MTDATFAQASELPDDQQKNLIRIQNSLNFGNVQESLKIYEVDRQLSEKISCAVICIFNETLNITNRMTPVQIFETATIFCDTYTHESASDLILCFKLVKLGKLGKNYNRLDSQVIFEYFSRYLDAKYQVMDDEAQAFKAQKIGSINTPTNSSHLHQARLEQEKKNRQSEKDAITFYQAFQNLNFTNGNNKP